MATLSVKQSGGDYSTLASACSNASDNDIIEISGTWSSDDTAGVSISNDGLTIRAIGDSHHPGYPNNSSPTHYRHRVSSGNAITINKSGGTCTLEGLDVQNQSSGNSDECIRITDLATLNLTRCVMGFSDPNVNQYAVYFDYQALVVNLENCFFYRCVRSVICGYQAEEGTELHINSCSCYEVANEGNDTGLGFTYFNTSKPDIWAFNSSFHIGTDWGIVGYYAHDLTVDRCIISGSDWKNLLSGSLSVTDSYTERTWTDNASPGTGDWVVVESTSSPYDMRLKDSAENDAQDAHADGSGAGLTMPSDDIVGTTRPQNTNYDIGCHEYEAAGGTGVDVSHSISSFFFTSGTHTVPSGADTTHAVGAIGYIAGAHVSGGGANRTHTATGFSLVIGIHSVSIGANKNHTTSSFALSPKIHTAAAGAAINHSTVAITLTPGTHSCATGASYQHNTTQFALGSGAHSAGIGANTPHVSALFTTTPGTHTVSSGVNVIHEKSIFTITLGTHTVSSGVNVIHNKSVLSITLGDHVVITGASINHSTAAITLILGSHLCSTGVNCVHNINQFTIILGDHTVSTGVNCVHNINQFIFDSGTHTVPSGVNVIHEKSEFVYVPKAHTFSIGGVIGHSVSTFTFSSGNHICSTGAAITHAIATFAFIPGIHTVATGSSILHTTSSFGFSAGAHTVGIGAAIHHVTASFALTPGAHTVSSGGSISHTTAVFEFITGNHVPATGASANHTSVSFEFSANTHECVTGAGLAHSTGTMELMTGTHTVTTGYYWELAALGNVNGQTGIISLIEYDGDLLGGTYPGANLLRFDPVAEQWSVKCDQIGTEEHISYMFPHEGRLYGITAGNNSDGLLVRLNDVGDAWETVCPKYMSETWLLSAAVFDGRIYVGTGVNGLLLRVNDAGDAFELVCPQYGGQETLYGLGVYNNKLYGGTGLSTAYVLRLNDSGDAWEQIGDAIPDDSAIRTDFVMYHNRLYFGTLNSATWKGGLYRITADGNGWELVGTLSDAHLSTNMTVFADRLYISTTSSAELYEYDNSTETLRKVVPDTWEGQTWGGRERVRAVCSYNGAVYGGTTNPFEGSYGAYLLRLIGPSSPVISDATRSRFQSQFTPIRSYHNANVQSVFR